MSKNYYDNEKEKYIIEKLSTTKIDKVFWPIITEVMLRRRAQFDLRDDFFKRDVETFVKNVNKIEVKDLEEHTAGEYNRGKKSIVINSKLFDESKFSFEEIFAVFCHECTHGMNFEKQPKSRQKADRTFNSKNILGIFDERAVPELFTQVEGESLVQDPLMKHGYSFIINYMDVLACTFGIRKNDLLKSAVEGKTELNQILNNSLKSTQGLNTESPFFDKIKSNVELLSIAYLEKLDSKNTKVIKKQSENIKNAHSNIYRIVEEIITERINELDISDIDKFKEEYEKIVIDQKTVQNIMEQYHRKYYDENEEIRNSTKGKYDIADLKLKTINEILNNPEIENKKDLITKIQAENEIENINEIINSNDLVVDLSKPVEVDYEKAVKYKNEILSIEENAWDNNPIANYIKNNKDRILATKNNKFEQIKKWFSNKFKGLGKDTRLALPEGQTERTEQTEEVNKKEPPSWDLKNWDMDKEDINAKTAELAENAKDLNGPQPGQKIENEGR